MTEQVIGLAEQSAGVVERAVLALEAFGERPEWGVREFAAHLGLAPSSAHGLLATLEQLGLVRRTPARRYRLGWRAAGLARTLEEGLEPVAAARPILTRLADRTGETVHLATLDDVEVVYLAKVEGRYAVRLASRVGQRFPAHATAAGKALLARDPAATARRVERGLTAVTPRTITDPDALASELETVRANGFALDREEMERDAGCISVPVASGTPLALSLSGPLGRIGAHIDDLERELLDGAALLSDALGGLDREAA